MKTYGGVNELIHVILTSTLPGVERSASLPGRFTPWVRAPRTHWIGSCVGPKTGLEGMVKREFFTLLGLELWPFSRLARSQSLYRLRYPASLITSISDY
jgi:hypothetical protein